MNTQLAAILEESKEEFQAFLDTSFVKDHFLLTEAMAYSLKAGGKRLRPLLFLLAAKTYQKDTTALLPFALAIEMIHTYSLIHDDLPAMDNDDFRRGLPTCHKKYGEAVAILAGDGLLTDAFAQMTSLRHQVDGERLLQAMAEMAVCAGSGGMVKGQILDICGEGKPLCLSELQEIHFFKTGALIKAALVAGAILGGAPNNEAGTFRRYGEELGLAFQIADDILDQQGTFEQMGKSAGRDAKQQKTTYVTLLGLEEAKKAAEDAARQAKKHLEAIPQDTAVFYHLADYVIHRHR